MRIHCRDLNKAVNPNAFYAGIKPFVMNPSPVILSSDQPPTVETRSTFVLFMNLPLDN